MWILPLVGYAGVLLGFGFLTLAIGMCSTPQFLSPWLSGAKLLTIPIASGLYYLSELVEEHTVLAKKLLTRLIYGIIATQILLAVVDRLPLSLSLLSIGSHAVYAGNLRHFPIVKLSDPVFILSCSRPLSPPPHRFTFERPLPTNSATTRSPRPHKPHPLVPPLLRAAVPPPLLPLPLRHPRHPLLH